MVLHIWAMIQCHHQKSKTGWNTQWPNAVLSGTQCIHSGTEAQNTGILYYNPQMHMPQSMSTIGTESSCASLPHMSACQRFWQAAGGGAGRCICASQMHENTAISCTLSERPMCMWLIRAISHKTHQSPFNVVDVSCHSLSYLTGSPSYTTPDISLYSFISLQTQAPQRVIKARNPTQPYLSKLVTVLAEMSTEAIVLCPNV